MLYLKGDDVHTSFSLMSVEHNTDFLLIYFTLLIYIAFLFSRLFQCLLNGKSSMSLPIRSVQLTAQKNEGHFCLLSHSELAFLIDET